MINNTHDKVILVDAINTLVDEDTGIFQEMYELLEKYPNNKIILTGANQEQIEEFGLNDMPYEVFTLMHVPEKTDPQYYIKMLEKFELQVEDVIYFEHNSDACKSAESIGIKTMFYDSDKKDLTKLTQFLKENIFI
ncbi:HAD hydrolase-like protein [bacterium]|nr:HAD hydrolase-like protein [bacterium]